MATTCPYQHSIPLIPVEDDPGAQQHSIVVSPGLVLCLLAQSTHVLLNAQQTMAHNLERQYQRNQYDDDNDGPTSGLLLILSKRPVCVPDDVA